MKEKQDVDKEEQKIQKIEHAYKVLNILHKEINYSVEQLSTSTAAIKDCSFTVNDTVGTTVKQLEQSSAILEKASAVLNNLPERIEQQIARMPGEIAGVILELLNEKTKESLNDDLKTYHESLVQLNDEKIRSCSEALQHLTREIHIVTKQVKSGCISKLKKICATTIVAVIIPMIVATGSTYFMMKKFPPFVTVNHTGNLQVEHSEVSIWGNNNLKTQQEAKIKK